MIILNNYRPILLPLFIQYPTQNHIVNLLDFRLMFLDFRLVVGFPLEGVYKSLAPSILYFYERLFLFRFHFTPPFKNTISPNIDRPIGIIHIKKKSFASAFVILSGTPFSALSLIITHSLNFIVSFISSNSCGVSSIISSIIPP